MGLKHNSFNGDIVLERKLKLCKKKFWKIVKIAYKNESYKLVFQEDA